jgi:hypothetical protein
MTRTRKREGNSMPGLTYTLFHPVAGLTRTTGWTVSIGSRLTGKPAALEPSAIMLFSPEENKKQGDSPTLGYSAVNS